MGRLAIFDFNGTLIDDSKEWWECVVKTFQEDGFKKDDIPKVEQFIEAMNISKGIGATYRHFGVKMPTEQMAALYEETYTTLAANTGPYPSALRTLQILKANGIACALVTWHLKKLFESQFLQCGFNGCFDYLGVEVRDKTAAIQSACSLESVKLRDCYYIGDMPIDIVCSRNAGVKSVALLTKMVPRRLIEAQRPDYIISDLEELPKIILKTSSFTLVES